MRLREVDPSAGPAITFRWGRRIPDAAITVLFGDGGVGKSTVALGLAVAMTAGQPFLGEATSQGPVLYVDAELTAPIVGDIARKIASGMGLGELPADLHYHRLVESLATPQGMAELRHAVEESRAALVIVDSFEAATPALEAFSLAEVGGVLDGLARLGVAVLVVDHVAKMGPDMAAKRTPYGAAVKLHRSRAGYLLRKRGDGSVLGCEKSSYTERLPALQFKTVFADGAIRFDVAIGEGSGAGKRESVDERLVNVLVNAAVPLSLDTLAERVGTSKKSIANRLSKLRRDGHVERVGAGLWARDSESTALPNARSGGSPAAG